MKCKRCDSEEFIQNNDKVKRFAKVFYIKQKEGERELDSGETGREYFVRGKALQQEKDSVINETDH